MVKSSSRRWTMVLAFLFLPLLGCSGGAAMGENDAALHSANNQATQGDSNKGSDQDGLGSAGVVPGPIPSHSDPQDSPPDEKKGYQEGQ